MQALWGENLEWDTPVPEKFISLWKAWLEELFELPNFIKIPRHLGFGINNKIELHVFVDASTKVFAATVYARILEMREPNDLDNGVTARGENQNHLTYQFQKWWLHLLLHNNESKQHLHRPHQDFWET